MEKVLVLEATVVTTPCSIVGDEEKNNETSSNVHNINEYGMIQKSGQ